MIPALRDGPGDRKATRGARARSRVCDRLLIASLAVVVALALGGCAGTKRFFKGMFGANPPLPPCPKVFIVGDAERLIKFRPGPGRDLTDVMYEGEIDNFRLVCEHEIDEDTKTGTLSLELTLVILVERGPANEDRQARYEYFVTLSDNSLNILKKELFASTARFEGNVTRFVFTDEPINMTIPLKAQQTGKDFQIFLGFQLSRDEVDFNRSQQGIRGR